MEILGKLFKFAIFVVVVGILAIIFGAFGWGRLVLSLVILIGGFIIFEG